MSALVESMAYVNEMVILAMSPGTALVPLVITQCHLRKRWSWLALTGR